jgi:hypothetical protein
VSQDDKKAREARAFFSFVDETSLELSSSPAITLGAATWSSDSTGVAFENEGLEASIPYTFTLNTKGVSGNALAATTPLTFTTSSAADTTAPTPPTGLGARPRVSYGLRARNARNNGMSSLGFFVPFGLWLESAISCQASMEKPTANNA